MTGRFVCRECIAEESKILRTNHQLSKLDQAIVSYLEDASNQRQHPSQAQVLENEYINALNRWHVFCDSRLEERIDRLIGRVQEAVDAGKTWRLIGDESFILILLYLSGKSHRSIHRSAS